MIEDTGKLYQIVGAVALAVAFFLFSYFASPRKTVPWLICLSPFQTIDTPYTTSSVMLTYVVGIAYILHGKLKYLPMLGVFLVIMAMYLASTGFAHRATYVQHGLYMFNYVSAILMFYIVYNFVRETKDLDLVIRTLIILNVVVVAHSILQAMFGSRLAFLGVEELTLRGGRGANDPRLAGPYGVGLTAEYLVLSILFIAYLLIDMKSGFRRKFLYALMALNLGCLIATANRGGFLTLIGGAGLFLFMYRKQLGVKRTLTLSISGIFLITIASVVVLNYTNYAQMYQRLEATEVEGGVPDTRAKTWSAIWPAIVEEPVIGHGPRLRLYKDTERAYPGTKVYHYPHNLYLFLLFTTGVIGLLVYLGFFAWLVVRFRRAIKRPSGDPLLDGFIKLGILSMVVFLVDQIKIEFLRYELIDYWHYVFMLFAMWLGLADMSRAGTVREAVRQREAAYPRYAAPARPLAARHMGMSRDSTPSVR